VKRQGDYQGDGLKTLRPGAPVWPCETGAADAAGKEQ